MNPKIKAMKIELKARS